MKVLFKKPFQKPIAIDIKNELKELQSLVEGYIEVVPLEKKYIIICNEEGKLQNLKPNWILRNSKGEMYDMVVGNMIICRETVYGEFADLTDKDIKYLKEKHFNN